MIRLGVLISIGVPASILWALGCGPLVLSELRRWL